LKKSATIKLLLRQKGSDTGRFSKLKRAKDKTRHTINFGEQDKYPSPIKLNETKSASNSPRKSFLFEPIGNYGESSRLSNVFGTKRGKCNMSGCNCQLFISQYNSIQCENCYHFPAYHVDLGRIEARDNSQEAGSRSPKRRATTERKGTVIKLKKEKDWEQDPKDPEINLHREISNGSNDKEKDTVIDRENQEKDNDRENEKPDQREKEKRK